MLKPCILADGDGADEPLQVQNVEQSFVDVYISSEDRLQKYSVSSVSGDKPGVG